jgi:hypothetical protein
MKIGISRLRESGREMDESVGLMVALGVVGLLAMIAVYRFVTQRKQLSSGRTVGRLLPQKHDGKIVFEDRMTITTGGKWCRLLLTLKSADASRIQYSPKYFFEKVALLVGTPYALTIRDARNRVVHTEAGSLGRFVAWLGSRHRGRGTLWSERFSGSHQGTVTLLEFLPKDAGPYSFSLHITEKAEAEYPGSASTWEVLEAELTAMEDVIPLSTTVRYPHQRVRF